MGLKIIINKKYKRTRFVHFDDENEILHSCFMVLLVLLAKTIKKRYQTKHSKKLEFYFIIKNSKNFFLNKNMYGCKQHIIGEYI